MGNSSANWWQRTMRWGQINIREMEPPNFDVSWWEEYWKKIHLDGITLNAGGIVAYYPTKLEDQHRSRWLGDRDLFGELVQAVKRCNMKILARIDPGESYEDVYFRHPDWFAVDQNGKPLCEEFVPELYIPCMNGPYYWEFVPEIMKEIHSMYDVDGTFCSEWDGRRRICYCPRCRALFKKDTDYDLPSNSAGLSTSKGNWAAFTQWKHSPTQEEMAWKKWVMWHQYRTEMLWKFWDKVNEDTKPGTFWMGNHSDIGFLADYAKMINVDNQNRIGDTPLWAVGEKGKRMHAITRGKKPYYHVFSSNSYARHVAKPEAEYRLYIADAILADSRPWFTIIGGVQDDKRQFGPLEDMYRWHYENEQYLRNRQSIAEVAIVFSDREKFIPDGKRDINAFSGMYYAMLRNRIPFDLVHAGRMDEEALAPYKLLILPNTAALADSEAEQIKNFVKHGGSVIATYETGMYDEWGRPRTTGVLDDLLGIAHHYSSIGPLVHSYAHLHGSHPLLAGLEDTCVTHNSEFVSQVMPASGTNASLLTMIPPYIIYPPEMAFSLNGDSKLPLLLLTGGAEKQIEGRRVYWAGNVDSFLYKTNSPDYSRLLLNAVKWAFNGDQIAEVVGTGLIEMHPYKQEKNIQIHLVNFTTPDIWKAPVHELLSAGPQTVRIRLSEGQNVDASAKCLVSGKQLPVKQTNGWAEVQLTDLLDHEIIVFNLN